MFSRKNLPGMLCILAVLFISSGFLALDIFRMNHSAHDAVSRFFSLPASGFQDSDSALDEISGDRLIIHSGKGLKVFEQIVELPENENWKLFLSLEVSGEEPGVLHLALCSLEDRSSLCEYACEVQPGQSSAEAVLDYQAANYPPTAILQLSTSDAVDLSIGDLSGTAVVLSHEPQPLGTICFCVFLALFVLSGILLCLCLIRCFRSNTIKTCGFSRIGQEFLLYILVFLLVTAGLAWLYRTADLSLPFFTTDGDEMGIFFLSKAIRENGTTLMTPMEGGAAGADMFDYPYSDKLSFLIVRFISLWTSNPYLSINLFYLLCYHLCACSALTVCRRLEISKPVSVLVSVLFAFSPFITERFSHMWLIPSFMIPPACFLGIRILQGRWHFAGKNLLSSITFWKAFALSYLCAFTGLYYAFFTCAIVAAAVLIRFVSAERRGNPADCLLPCLFILAVLLGIITNVLPNLLYTAMNGGNPYSELAVRNASDTELYGLKMIQMLLPRLGHRIRSFAEVTELYSRTFPLVTENQTASLGMIGSAGFLLSLLLLLSGDRELRPVVTLNLSAFLIGTVGGLGTLFGILISNPMRCYNRISLVILFLSLLVIAQLLERLRAKVALPLLWGICLVLTGLGLYDQTSPYWRPDYSHFRSVQEAVSRIEDSLQPGDSVFVLPYDDWPTSKVPGSYRHHMLYVESRNLHWSYGAMQGRTEARWQSAVSGLASSDLIARIQRAGYEGVCLDKTLYERKYGEEPARQRIDELSDLLGSPAVVSSDGILYFWICREPAAY